MSSQVVSQIWTTYLIIGCIVNACLAFIPAYIAKSKGRSYRAFWALSFFASIFVALIAVLAIPARENIVKSSNKLTHDSRFGLIELPVESKCPNCAEYIKTEAKICRFCQANVSDAFQALANEVASNNKSMIAWQAAEAEKNEKISRKQLEITLRNREIATKRFLQVIRKPVVLVTISLLFVSAVAISFFTISNSNQEKKLSLENLNKATQLITKCAEDLGYESWAQVRDNDLASLEVKYIENNYNPAFINCVLVQTVGAKGAISIETNPTAEYSGDGISISTNEYFRPLNLKFNSGWSEPSTADKFPDKFQALAEAFERCNPKSGYRYVISGRPAVFTFEIVRIAGVDPYVQTSMSADDSNCLIRSIFSTDEATLASVGFMVDSSQSFSARITGSASAISLITFDAK